MSKKETIWVFAYLEPLGRVKSSPARAWNIPIIALRGCQESGV